MEDVSTWCLYCRWENVHINVGEGYGPETLRHFCGNILWICNLGWWTEHDNAWVSIIPPSKCHCRTSYQTLPIRNPHSTKMWLADLQVKACSRTGPNHLQMFLLMWLSGLSFGCRYQNTSELPTEQNPHDTVFFSKLLENGNKSLKHWNRTTAGHSSPFAFDSFTTIPMEHSHIV